MKPHTHITCTRCAGAQALRRSLFITAVAGVSCFLSLANTPVRAAESAVPDTIPGLPQGRVTRNAVPAATKQQDRQFLDQIEEGQPPASAKPQSQPPEPMHDASSPILAKTAPAPQEVAPPEPAPQAAPAQAPEEALSPAEAATRPNRPDVANRDAAAPSRSRDVEPRRAPVVRHTTSRALAPLIAQGDDEVESTPPAAAGGFQAPATRTRTITTYSIAAPAERTVTTEPEEAVPYLGEPEYYEARPRHHGFFHRLFHHHDDM